MQTHGVLARLRPGARSYGPALEGSVRAHLGHLLQSPQFDASTRSREFLNFVVEEALAGRGENLNQATIALAVFRRMTDFDPVLDPIVRVQAGRLRRSLERYYLLTGGADSIRIELPKGGYAPVFAQTASAQSDRQALARSTPTEVEPAWPTVVVHPFEVFSLCDEEAAVRAANELTMELCRYGVVRVVRQRDIERLVLQQQAFARFELRGRLRQDGDDTIVGARLVNRLSGEELWSDEFHTGARPGRWSGSADDIARVIAARIGAEHGIIVRLPEPGRWPRAAAGAGPATLLLRGQQFFISCQADKLVPAIEAVQRLTEREPEIAAGWTSLARLQLADHAFELSQRPASIEKVIASAHRGVLLDPTSAGVRCVLAAALLVKGELQAARHELERALRLNGDSLAYRELVGWLTALAGEWEQGIALMRETMERNPYYLPQVQHGLWAYHLRRGDYEAAYLAALAYSDSGFFWRELMTACCLGHLGRLGEARASAAELLRLRPDFPQCGCRLIGYYIKADALRERIVEGLQNAGMTLSA